MTSRPPAGAGNEIRALTGLRGVAAAYVVLFHFAGHGRDAGSMLGQIRLHGYLAVDVFFVLSGYVMALTYGGLFARGGSAGAYGAFLLKRVSRLYPAYLAATLACAALSVVDPAVEGPLTTFALATNLLMVQAWGLSYSLDYPGWSLSAELVAYLLFPALAAAALGGRRARPWVTASVAAGVLLVLATRSAGELSEVGGRVGPLDIWSADTAYPVLRCLCGFSLGLCAWRASLVPGVQRVARHPAVGLGLCVAVLALLATPDADVAVVLVTALMVASLAQGASWPARALATRPLHWLGTVSYSLYLVHYPLAWALAPPLRAALVRVGAPSPDTLVTVALVVLSGAVAGLTYAWVERPGRNLSRAFLGRRRPIAASVLEPL